jgi:hypothetical protein
MQKTVHALVVNRFITRARLETLGMHAVYQYVRDMHNLTSWWVTFSYPQLQLCDVEADANPRHK